MKIQEIKFSWLLPLLISTLLVACGGSSNDNNDAINTNNSSNNGSDGSDGSDGDDGSDPEEELGFITMENAETLASVVASDFLFVVESESLEKMNTLISKRQSNQASSPSMVSLKAKAPITTACDEGEVILDDTLVSNFPFPATGDVYDYTFLDCTFEEFFTTNGRELVEVFVAEGEIEFNGTGGNIITTFQDGMELTANLDIARTYIDFDIAIGNSLSNTAVTNFLFNGIINERHLISSNEDSVTSSSDFFSVVSTWGNPVQEHTLEHFEYASTQIFEEDDGIFLNFTAVNTQFISSLTEGRFEFETLERFETGFISGGPTRGEGVVRGRDGSSLLIQAQLNGFDVMLSLDEDGDEFYEEIIMTNWDNLNLYIQE